MSNDVLIQMLIEGLKDTLYMTLVSTLFAYIFGLPIGVLLTITNKDGINPKYFVYKFLDIVVNITRSVPFLILLIAVIPFTKLVVGKSYGKEATVVPLVIASTPFVARMIESSLMEVEKGVIEAALSMGASVFTVVRKVLIPEAKNSLIVGATIVIGTVLSYSAMAGVVGGGGLGDIAIRYGYYRYQTKIMIITVVILIVLVQILQEFGMTISKLTDKRKRG